MCAMIESPFCFFLIIDCYSELKLISKFHCNSQAKQLFISYFYIYILSCIYTDIPLYEHADFKNKKNQLKLNKKKHV